MAQPTVPESKPKTALLSAPSRQAHPLGMSKGRSGSFVAPVVGESGSFKPDNDGQKESEA